VDRLFRIGPPAQGQGQDPKCAALRTGERSGKDSVFFDGYYESELARPNLDVLLQRIYRNNADLVVVFHCAGYETKEWCGLEWRAIRDLIRHRQDDRIMHEAEVSGLFGIDGCLDLETRSPEDCAEAIHARVNALGTTTDIEN
jgi:hypothetical protein